MKMKVKMKVKVKNMKNREFMMKKLFILFTLFFGFSFPVYADGFMSAFEEIPLQDGFEEEEPLSFDTEEVRIIEQYITSTTVSKDDFFKFYRATLKSLGWNLVYSYSTRLGFRREDEELILNIEIEDPLVVLFTLRPYEK